MIKIEAPIASVPEQSSTHSHPDETLLTAIRDFANSVEWEQKMGATLSYPLFIAGEPSAFWRSVLEAIEREEAKQSAAEDKLTAIRKILEAK